MQRRLRQCGRAFDLTALIIFAVPRNALLGSPVCRKGDIGASDVTAHDFYVRRAVECALAAESTPNDRDVLLHMAATYVRIAADIEMRQADRHRAFIRARRRQDTACADAEASMSAHGWR
jgi:hypothetical protein